MQLEYNSLSRPAGLCMVSMRVDNGHLPHFSREDNSELCVVRPLIAAELLMTILSRGEQKAIPQPVTCDGKALGFVWFRQSQSIPD
jgi:hypothetical protein